MENSLIEIKLLGELGRKFGRVWHLAIASPAQAIRAIAANCPNFYDYLRATEEKGIGYRVVIDDPLGIDASLFHLLINQDTKIIIAPQVVGSGGGLGKILLGGALIAASIFMPASISILGFGLSSSAIGLVGAALLFQGISTMISPTPKTPKKDADTDKTNSFLFDRASTVGKQGSCVPVGYGERIITDLTIISSAIVTQEIPIG